MNVLVVALLSHGFMLLFALIAGITILLRPTQQQPFISAVRASHFAADSFYLKLSSVLAALLLLFLLGSFTRLLPLCFQPSFHQHLIVPLIWVIYCTHTKNTHRHCLSFSAAFPLHFSLFVSHCQPCNVTSVCPAPLLSFDSAKLSSLPFPSFTRSRPLLNLTPHWAHSFHCGKSGTKCQTALPASISLSFSLLCAIITGRLTERSWSRLQNQST